MKIVDVKSAVLGTAWRNITFVRVITDEGLERVGEVKDGYFALPQGPGLGVTLDEAVLKAHPQQRIFFNLFAEGWHRRQAQLPSEGP